MSESFLSPSWHLVSALRPQLQPHSEITRQRLRGKSTYVIRNPATGRSYRFPTNVYLVLSFLDGKRTVNEAWTAAVQQLSSAAPTQDETIRLLSQLHDADLIQTEREPEIAELAQRRSRFIRQRWLQALGNPLSLRIPLWDPDRFLTRTMPLIQPLVSRFGFLLWLAVVIPSLIVAASHWSELTEDLTDRLLAAENLLYVVLVFPVVKALHELGHGYAVKAGGGEVHEIGLMFLVLLPIPYVDASAANAFRSKWRRAGVGAAGMLVETFVAAIMLYVWLLTEPGIVRLIAFNTMAISGISTVVFNGNPLLRFDGYYILSDLTETPNLAMRAASFWGWLVERFGFGRHIEPPVSTPGERALFLFYAPASILYRLYITLSIAVLMAQRFFVIGILIAIWGMTSSLLVPVYRWGYRLFTSPGLASVRGRAISVTGFAIGAVALTLAVLPLPLHTVSEGILWLPDEAIVRAQSDGFVTGILVKPGAVVEKGTELFRHDDRDLAAELVVEQARVEAAAARLARDEAINPLQTGVSRRELDVERAALSRVSEKWNELTVASKASGEFVVPRAEDVLGRYHKRGEVLAYIVPSTARTARVIVRQDDIDLVRQLVVGAELRLATNIADIHPARIMREVPAASNEFPDEALTLQGGGSFAADMRYPAHPRALNRLFQFDVELPPEAAITTALGEHVWVRFYHGIEPLGFQWWRRIRQLFLTRFDA